MVFFRSATIAEPFPLIESEGVILRAPQMADYAQWAELRESSRDFLMPWEPTWPADDLTRAAFRRRLRRYSEDLRNDHTYPFFAFEKDGERLVGGLTLTNIRRGVAQAASLGYWIGEPFARQGYMSRAVRALIPFTFDVLRLHRLEAACIPTNTPSVRLLEKCSFEREGYARDYLCINGQWQDHLLYARLKEPQKAVPASSTSGREPAPLV